jgi:hypothetical protein
MRMIHNDYNRIKVHTLPQIAEPLHMREPNPIEPADKLAILVGGIKK